MAIKKGPLDLFDICMAMKIPPEKFSASLDAYLLRRYSLIIISYFSYFSFSYSVILATFGAEREFGS